MILLNLREKWEERSGVRSIEKSFKRLSYEKEQSNGTMAEGECEGQGHCPLSFTRKDGIYLLQMTLAWERGKLLIQEKGGHYCKSRFLEKV